MAPLSSCPQGIRGSHGSTVGTEVGSNVVGIEVGALDGSGPTGGSVNGGRIVLSDGCWVGTNVGMADGMVVGTGLGGAMQGPQYPRPFWCNS